MVGELIVDANLEALALCSHILNGIFKVIYYITLKMHSLHLK